MPGFRPPLDVSEYLKQYEAFGGTSTAGAPRIDTEKPWYEQAPGAIERDAEIRRREEHQANNPMVMGYGPLVASTCRDLAPFPMHCWDVLGYYRTMGVHWKATKKELMAAYQAFGTMPTAYQTHVFKQLLDPAKRRAYDATPLGHLFMDDHYVQQMLKNKAAAEAARRSKAGTPTTAREVIEEEFKFVPEEPEEGLDGTASDGPDSEASATVPFPFSWFSWRSSKTAEDVLAEWQTLVIQAVAEQGAVLNVAVGFFGKQPHRYLVGKVGKTNVAFLSDKECPTPALASAAALALINDMKTR
jgi:hypothetical protein